MDRRLFIVLLVFVLPSVLVGVTIAYFGSNPIAILLLLATALLGGLYLLTYSETFAGPA